MSYYFPYKKLPNELCHSLITVMPSTPHKVFEKLIALNIDPALSEWVLDFLLDRTEDVKIGSHMSDTITMNTGGPQGCILSPQLYGLFIFDCVSNFDNCIVFKYADDISLTLFPMIMNKTFIE